MAVVILQLDGCSAEHRFLLNLGLDMIIVSKEKKSPLLLTELNQEQSWEALEDGALVSLVRWKVFLAPACVWGLEQGDLKSPFQHKPLLHCSNNYTLVMQSPGSGMGIETRKRR